MTGFTEHDPAQKFTVSVVTREMIAEQLNEFCACNEFWPGDERLTDELCQWYARALHDATLHDSPRARDKAEYEAVRALAGKTEWYS